MQDTQALRPEALARFWSWWATAKNRIASAIADRSLGRSPVVAEISAAVHDLNADLAWELGPGRSSKHNLTVTAEGNLGLRRLAAQWIASAPAPDPTWEYHDSRQPSSQLRLEIGGKQFAPEEFRVGYSYDDSRERFDIQLFHPLFKKSDQNLIRQVLFLTLDQCLGEDDVERWIGSLEPATSVPRGAIDLAHFVAEVAKARENVTGERFTIGQGQSRDGRPVFIIVNSALKQIDHLDHVFYLGIAIGVRQPDSNGLPAKSESDALNAAEDRLLEGLGANAVHIGRVTWGGRREIHLFVRDPAAAAATFAAWSAGLAPWSASHTIAFDPRWDAAKTGIYAALAPRR